MIIVRLMGGLGNQMFQYAAGLSLAARLKTSLKLDLTFLLDRAPRENFMYRDFDLGLFQIPEKVAGDSEVRRFRRQFDGSPLSRWERLVDKYRKSHFFHEACAALYDPKVLELPNDTYLEGYFQKEDYFLPIESLIRRRFCIDQKRTAIPAQTADLANVIQSQNAICIQVRRGDYVNNPSTSKFHGVCSINYFKTSLELLRHKGVDGPVYVVSDDIPWCRANFAALGEINFIGEEHQGPSGILHFWLMSLCRYFIISNSTFAWWAAWLAEDKNKIVICPDPWFADEHYRQYTICPERWIKMPIN